MKKQMYFLLLVLLSVYVGVPARANETNSRDYCTASSPVILFVDDRTTKYDDADVKNLEDGLYAAVSELRAGDRLVVREIGDDAFASSHVFDDCRPGCVARSFWERMNCSNLALTADVLGFQKRASSALKTLPATTKEYPHSDILETLTVLSNEYRDAHVVRVIVFTDLLENTKQLPESLFLQGRSDLVAKRIRTLGLTAQFPDADVLIFGVGRHDGPTRRGLTIHEWQSLRSIWTAWFKASGATSVHIYQWYPSPR